MTEQTSPNTYFLTDDVWDICDHGVNAAVHTCGDCEADIAGVTLASIIGEEQR